MRILLSATLFCLVSSAFPQTLPSVGTFETLGKVDGVEIQAKVQGPAAEDAPLQIICLFEYTEGDIYISPPALPKESNGLVHVDQALHGLITELRKTNKFAGKALETLLIEPPKNTITPKKLLLIGLGDRKDFQVEMMYWVGVVGMREALSLGVARYSHASDLKDAGFDSPTKEIAANVIEGALTAYRTQSYLKKQKASAPLTVNKLTVLAGPAYFEDAKTGIQKAIKSLTQ